MRERFQRAGTKLGVFMRNGKLRRWLLFSLSQKTTWFQIFTFVATVTGAQFSEHYQDAIATAGTVICTVTGILSSPDNSPDPTPGGC